MNYKNHDTSQALYGAITDTLVETHLIDRRTLKEFQGERSRWRDLAEQVAVHLERSGWRLVRVNLDGVWDLP